MNAKNIFYAQSGGPTAVINVTALAVIETARQYGSKIGKVYAGKNGIIGALNEELIDTSVEPLSHLQALQYTPGSAFGSCRFKLNKLEDNDNDYRRLIEVCAAHDIGYFFYNGGNDSQDTVNKIAHFSQKMNSPLVCIGLPKTIDNDLAYTDNCPGFGSVAKYIATSTLEASFDLASMCATSTQIFILEVMGRHAGWIAASAGLAQQNCGEAPHIILVPEIAFDKQKFLAKVKETVEKHGHCVIVTSEGIRDQAGLLINDSRLIDAFGHHQLGGVAPILANLIKNTYGYKYHWSIADYLQRSARHIASQTDYEQAYAIGKAAVDFSLKGINNVMLTIERENTPSYQWHVGSVPLRKVANVEKKLPRHFINKEGFAITKACRDYLMPLVEGEAYPIYQSGLPHYVRLQNKLVKKKTAAYTMPS